MKNNNYDSNNMYEVEFIPDTGAKKAKKSVSTIIAVTALVATLGITGAYLTKSHEDKIINQNNVVVEFFKPETKYTLQTNTGNTVTIGEEELITQIDNINIVKINETIYSRHSDDVMEINANYKSEDDNNTYTMTYYITPEEYVTSLEKIINESGNLKSYSAKLVEATAIEELYHQLGIDKDGKKLTK